MPRPAEQRGPPANSSRALVVAGQTLGNLVALCLRHSGCSSDIAVTLASARERMETRPDLLLLDIGLSGGEAIALLRSPPGEAGSPPTVALMRPSDRWSSLEAFGRGADQVIALPFTPDELAVRAFALLRRFKVATRITHAEPLGGLLLNIDETIQIKDRTIRLTPAQNSLLYLLAANSGREVHAADVRKLTWGLDSRASDAELERRVGDLRRILADVEGPHIESLDHSFVMSSQMA